ncbi:maleylpyruvate isomerase family mycothiol-dependent enzyme [Amycolatopsis sp. NPDC059657]|uniref:maleylpyruvate isomerase family mycothiol-dependent enzyme n=1 Tax=Amycolatopsis sp. NPDC059657 TaxID=3346899 RepID=UPI0036728923
MTEYWGDIDSERASLADQLDDLTEAEWKTPSLCEGWTAREVVAHLTYPTRETWGEMLGGLIRAKGDFDRMTHESAIKEAAPFSNAELVAGLRAIVGSRRLAPLTKPSEPLFEILLHAQDIMRPLGRPRPMPPAAALKAVERIWSMGFPFNAKKKLKGFRLNAVDVSWSAGEGELIEGPVEDLLLLVSGRTEIALPHLSGDGAAALKE